jgi:hypothetical protein
MIVSVWMPSVCPKCGNPVAPDDSFCMECGTQLGETTPAPAEATIQSVVLARVDRLQEEAKYVLQCASVIGRLFRYRLLQHISRQERDLHTTAVSIRKAQPQCSAASESGLENSSDNCSIVHRVFVVQCLIPIWKQT